MASKTISTMDMAPVQLGFGFGIADAAGEEPPFLHTPSAVYAALDRIQQAQWVSVDVETTGLTDGSVSVAIEPKLWRQGADPRVRMRLIQARVPTLRGRHGPREDFAFDCDRMGPGLTQEVADVMLRRRLFIAHNAGFDLYWLRLVQGRTAMPAMVADSMLLTRLLRPQLPLVRAHLVENIKHIADVESADARVKAAWKSLIGGASGSSLADVTLALFDEVVDKTYQKPANWTGLLGFNHYDYAILDVVLADRTMCSIMDIAEDGDILRAYLGQRARKSTVRLVEPQVPELVLLREHGVPINENVGRRYVGMKRLELVQKVDELIQVEPDLEMYRGPLADPDAGLDDSLKNALCSAFESRGVRVRRTANTAAPQVGEKDLRACRAGYQDSSRPLFDAWVAVCRSKRTSNMAQDVCGFAARSPGRRVRSLISHGPITGRLASSEFNGQQFPRDQLFRAMCISLMLLGRERTEIVITAINQSFIEKVAEQPVELGEIVEVPTDWLAAMFAADKKVPDWPTDDRKLLAELIEGQFSHRIVSSDFGALDVRVGAALAIRTQRDMLRVAAGEVIEGLVQPADEVVAVIKDVARCQDLPSLTRAVLRYKTNSDSLAAQMATLKEEFNQGSLAKNVYFKKRGTLKERLHLAKLGYRFAQCLQLGFERGEREYSALRDAFQADIDIHTFTGMKLAGRDPIKEFEGLSPGERKALEKLLKKELGPRRQQGKIANLSLTYGMADLGFQEAAARGYNEHWTLEVTAQIRNLWLDSYPEIELWHLWTECLKAGVIYMPVQGKEKPQRTGWWQVRTLAGRDVVAVGLNAALSYQDQGTGADILGMIMHRLYADHRAIFDCAVNQVHDEIVFEWPAEHHEAYLPIAERVMVEEADVLLMPYGVPAAVSPASGVLWIKD